MATLSPQIDDQRRSENVRHRLKVDPALIFVAGPAGVGKYTVARHIHEFLNPDIDSSRLQNHAKNSILFHNHLIIDLAAAVAPWNEADRHVALRDKVLEQSLATMLQDPNTNRSFIFTAQINVDSVDRKRIEELRRYLQFALDRKLRFPWFNLECASQSEHLNRLIHADRAIGKLKDVNVMMGNLNNPELRQADPRDVQDLKHAIDKFRVIQTQDRSAFMVAEEILDHTFRA